MDALTLSVDIRATGPGCRLVITLDKDLLLLDTTPCPEKKTHQLDLGKIPCGSHKLEMVMSGKSPSMTVLDQDNKIIKDTLIEINNLCIGDVDITDIFLQKNNYYHDLNGMSSVIIKDKFFGQMGCNGTISLEFSAPIYVWLLENL